MRTIEHSRLAVAATEPAGSSHACHVGRVGALALALGISSAISALPVAYADTTGSAGASINQASSGASTPSTHVTSPRRLGHVAGAANSSSSSGNSKGSSSVAAARGGVAAATAVSPRRNNSIAVVTTVSAGSAGSASGGGPAGVATPRTVTPSPSVALGAGAPTLISGGTANRQGAVAAATIGNVISSAPFQAISTAVDRFLTATANWLAAFPNNPITGIFEGTLYLLRRSLFPASVGVVTQPIQVPLYFTTIDSAGTQKVGIYASIGGGAPQLFEFDTGGKGLYATYAAANPEFSPWWGNAVDGGGAPVVNKYDSGLTYTGVTATSTVALFSAPGSQTALLATGWLPVAQIDSIQQENPDGQVEKTLWTPQGSTTAPVDNAFWGDFGMAPSYAPNGIANLIAQLTYAPCVLPGYRIHIDEKSQSAWLQIGLTAADVQNPTAMFFPMVPDASAPTGATTPNSGVRYYGPQVINATIKIVDSGGTAVNNADVGITPDTGAGTTLHNTDKSPTPDAYDKIIKWQNDAKTLGRLDSGLDFSLSGNTIGGASVSFFDFRTNDAVNGGQVEVQNNRPNNPTYYLNSGIALFYDYDVVYALGTAQGGGTFGLIPRVPA